MRPHHHHHLIGHRQMPHGPGAALAQFVVPLVVGVFVGCVLAFALRRLRLRWTWALCLIPVAYLSWLVSWRVGLGIAVTALTAIGGGLRLHLDDLGRGGEEARAAREAIGPFVVMRSLLAERGARRRRRRGATLAIGRTRRGSVCRVPLGGPGHGVHSLVVGATGAGKTVTMAALVQAHVAAGQGVIVLDPKGDAALRRTVAEAAGLAGVRLREWSPQGPTVYNPIGRGGVTEISDKCLAAHEWSEPHYRTATQRLLGNVLATMKAAGEWPPTLSGLVAHMEPERLDALASRLDGGLAERVHGYVDGLDARRRADLGGGRDRLAVLVESEIGPWLDPTLGAGEQIDLAVCLDRGEVAYFSFEADRYPETSKLLAAALVIDLAALAAHNQGAVTAGVVVIDEFGALAADHVSRLFARARGAGLSLLLGTQSLADLRAARPDDASDPPDRAGLLQRRLRGGPSGRPPRRRRDARPARRHRARLDADRTDGRRPPRRTAGHGDADAPTRLHRRRRPVQVARHRRGRGGQPEGSPEGRGRRDLAAGAGRGVIAMKVRGGPLRPGPASRLPIVAPSSLAASPFGARAYARPRLRLGFRSRRPAHFGGYRSQRRKEQR
jgi:hypothetical protein